MAGTPRASIYGSYAERDRFDLGIRLKKYQARRMFDMAAAYLGRDAKSVIEIGPGDGYIAEIAAAGGFRYVAVEGSSKVAEHLRGLGYQVVDGLVPPLPDGVPRADCCFLLHVIEHMRDFREAAQLLAEIGERLNPDGVLVVACPDFVRWGYRFFDCDYTHSTPFTRRRLEALLCEQGFLVRRFTRYSAVAFGAWSLPLGWMARLCYPAFVDDTIGQHLPRDIANRGMLTLLPNLLAVATKR